MNINKIFGIGYPKTGTSSLNLALRHLGYHSLHDPKDFQEIVWIHGQYILPNRSLDDPRRPWQAITNFGEYFFNILDKNYPNSKFILTIRDINSWYKSILNEIRKEKFEEPTFYYIKNRPYWWQLWIAALFDGIGFNESVCKNKFIKHQQLVFDYFQYRPEDLLVLNLEEEDKFTKLCNFLGCKNPEILYPHENRSVY